MRKTLERVKELFPEAQLISDVTLREKVLKTWYEAWNMSPFEDPTETPFLEGILTEINNVEHTRAVTIMSIQYAKTMKDFFNIDVNMDHLIAGAILHDIGKLFEFCNTPSDLKRYFSHVMSAVYVASRFDLPLEVIHIIGMHSLEGNLFKRTTEAAIIHYIDFASAEVCLRAKTSINLDEWRKARDLKKAIAHETKN
jgi:putative nucleotidyltransferase with HDIG domain